MNNTIWNIFLGVSSNWGEGYSGGGEGAIQDLNNTILKIATYAGAVIIAIGVTQMLMAFHEQNAASKTKAAVTLGLGILFLTASSVLTSLHLTDTTGLTAEKVAKNGLAVLSRGLTYTGVALAGIALFQLIMAIANEDAREKADGTKTLAVGIALYTAHNLIDLFLSNTLFKDNPSGAEIVGKIFGIIVFFARYVGIGFAAVGSFHFVLAMKDGDGSAKAKSALFIASGAAMLALKPLLNALNIDVP